MQFGLLLFLACLATLLPNGLVASIRSHSPSHSSTKHNIMRKDGRDSIHRNREYPNADSSKRSRHGISTQEGFPSEENDFSSSNENEVIRDFTRTFLGQLGVSLSAGLSMAIISHFLQTLIISHSWSSIIAVAFMSTAIAVYLQGNYSEFAKSLGVFAILVVQGMSIHRFIPNILRQFTSFLMLAPRRPFPPGTNPWRYSRNDPYYDPNLPKFSMTNVLFSLFLLGSFVGWSIAKPIPLFPSWLGAIGGALAMVYGGTLLDAIGDFLRFIGHTVLSVLSFLFGIADEVDLRENTRIMLGTMLFFMRGIDEQFQVSKNLRMVIAVLISKITSVIVSMKREQLMNDYGINPPRPPKNGRARPNNPSTVNSSEEDDFYYNEGR